MIAPSPAVELAFVKSPAVFARLRGRNGAVREYRALLVPTAEYCVLPKVDAYRLGYPEAASSGTRVPLPNTLTFASYVGYERGMVIRMAQVDIGSISFEEVEFLAFDILQAVGYDVVLGQNLLREMHLDLDFASGKMRLERAAGAQ